MCVRECVCVGGCGCALCLALVLLMIEGDCIKLLCDGNDVIEYMTTELARMIETNKLAYRQTDSVTLHCHTAHKSK